MKDIDLSSMISRAQVVFDILEKEYKVFLSSEKKDYIENLIFSSLFKISDQKNKLPIYLLDDTYYLNQDLDKEIMFLKGNDPYTNYLKNNPDNIYEEIVIFLCLSLLCGELNPLKIGLIELEVRKISEKHNIKTSSINNYKELTIAKLLKESIFSDLPFNIIFLDSDIEIFHYLTIEKGMEIAKFYHQISELMKDKYKELLNKDFTLEEYLNYYDQINYDDVVDLIYDFINMKIK